MPDTATDAVSARSNLCPLARRAVRRRRAGRAIPRSSEMGKYMLAWLLGVPAFVLVLVYMFVH
jgi:hypothetical protein